MSGVIDLGDGEGPQLITHRVEDLTAEIKKLQTTNEGKLQVTLESEGLDDDALDQVKEMLSLQQSALVKVAMTPVQRDMFEPDSTQAARRPEATDA